MARQHKVQSSTLHGRQQTLSNIPGEGSKGDKWGGCGQYRQQYCTPVAPTLSAISRRVKRPSPGLSKGHGCGVDSTTSKNECAVLPLVLVGIAVLGPFAVWCMVHEGDEPARSPYMTTAQRVEVPLHPVNHVRVRRGPDVGVQHNEVDGPMVKTAGRSVCHNSMRRCESAGRAALGAPDRPRANINV